MTAATSTTDPSTDARSVRGGGVGPWVIMGVLAVLLGVGALSLLSLRPPAPVAETAPDTVFSAQRAWPHVQSIAVEPHPVGSAAHDRVHDYLVQQLRTMGVEPRVAGSSPALRSRPGVETAAGLRNIIAVLPGTAPTGAVALVCHYDSHRRAPGAGDDGLAVAALVEVARLLRTGPPPRNDLVLLFTDGEELGLLGAQAFVQDDPTADDVRVVLNFEGRGSHGPVLMFETGPGNAALVRVFQRADPHPIASSLFPEAYRYLPNDTDFTVFLRSGIRGLNFAHIGRAETYHHASDTPANASRATLQHHGEHALAMARAFGALDLATLPGPVVGDAVYFNVPGLGLIRYPARLALAHAVVVLVLWAAAVMYAVRRRGSVVAGVTVGFGVSLFVLVVSTFAAWAAGRIAGMEAEAGSLTNKLVIDEWPYMLAIVAVAVAVVVVPVALFARRLGGAPLALGVTLLPALIGSAAAMVAPGASYLLLWPAFFAIVAAVVCAHTRTATLRDVVIVTVLLAFSVALWAPHLSLFLTGLTLTMAPALGAITAFAAMSLAPAAVLSR
jgi:hypothetical protein